MFVQDHRHIAGLVFGTYRALLVYCLMERQAHRDLSYKGGKMKWLLPVGHWARPTGENLIRVLAVYTPPFVQTASGPVPTIPLLSPLQQTIYQHLEVPETFQNVEA